MKFYNFFAIALISFLLFACSTKTAILMDEYKDNKLSGKDLAIVKAFENPSIINYDDVTDDLGSGVPEEVYMAFFKLNFIDAFKSNTSLKEIKFIDKFSKTGLTEKVLDISDEDKIRAYLPSEGNIIDSLKSDFILFLYGINSSRVAGQTGSYVNGAYIGGSFGKLYQQISFALWDNVKGKVVSYGRVDDDSSIIFGMTKGHWESVVNSLAMKLIRLSPFKIVHPSQKWIIAISCSTNFYLQIIF